MIMGGSVIVNSTTIETTDFAGQKWGGSKDWLTCTTESTVTITGEDLQISNIKEV